MADELTIDQKQEERVKAKQYAEMMQIEYVDPYPELDAPPAEEETPKPELSNEDLLKLVSERTGVAISSLDELNRLKPQPTEADIAAEAERRNTEMLAFGLAQSKFTKEEYDAYQLALSNKKDLVRTEIVAQIEAAFPEMSPDAIQEKVANYFFENLEETDPLRVARENEIMTLSDIKIKDKFKNIVNLAADFDQYNEGITNQTNFDRKVEATSPVYKADVSTALKSLQKFSVPVPDSKNPANTVNIELSYSDTDLKEVEDLLTTPDQIKNAVKEGYTPEKIKELADFILWKKHGPRLISQAAKGYNSVQKEGYIQARKGLNSNLDSIEVKNDNLPGSLDEVYNQLLESAKAN